MSASPFDMTKVRADSFVCANERRDGFHTSGRRRVQKDWLETVRLHLRERFDVASVAANTMTHPRTRRSALLHPATSRKRSADSHVRESFWHDKVCADSAVRAPGRRRVQRVGLKQFSFI